MENLTLQMHIFRLMEDLILQRAKKLHMSNSNESTQVLWSSSNKKENKSMRCKEAVC